MAEVFPLIQPKDTWREILADVISFNWSFPCILTHGIEHLSRQNTLGPIYTVSLDAFIEFSLHMHSSSLYSLLLSTWHEGSSVMSLKQGNLVKVTIDDQDHLINIKVCKQI